MTITSFYFLVLVAIGLVFYYLIPKSWQWVELLTLSLVYYYYAADIYTIIYLIISALIAYVSTIAMEKLRDRGRGIKSPFRIAMVAVVLNILIWFIVKGKGLWGVALSKLLEYVNISGGERIHGIQLVAALGMGYYTAQIIGYIIDCYWGTEKPQKNPLKLFLFVAYFPQLTTGPISRYRQLETLWQGHRFEYDNIAFGAQRILWGFLKKIVLAERVGVIVSGIYAAPEAYYGFYSWVAILLYPLQMYADFSGCMDIVLGVSEMFGIKLTENFKNPFFSRTSQEFWQRWHITLGTWAKDYVLYPLLKLPKMVKFGKVMRKRFGKRAGKFIVNLVGMFILWMVMGVWHGGLRYIVGVSLWYWMILMAGDLLSPTFRKLTVALNVKTESFGWHLFQSARTYVIYAVGAVFFKAGVTKGISLIKDAVNVITVRKYANPWIFFDGSIITLRTTYGDINIIILCLIMLLIVANLREKYGYARLWIQQQSFGLRWLIWLGLFVFVLIWGRYGPGYSAAEFIYQGF